MINLKHLSKLNFAGYIGTWLLFASLDMFTGLLLYALSLRGFALADSLRAILIDILLALPAIFFSRTTYKYYTAPVFIILLFVSFFNCFHILSYQSILSTYAIFAMVETTAQESAEFLTDQFSIIKVMVIFLSLILPYLIYTKILRPGLLFKKKFIALPGIIFCIASIFIAKGAIHDGYRFLASHPVYMTFWSLNNYYQEAQLAQDESALPPNIFGEITSEKGPQTYVIIVGESKNRNHMQAYGYPRKTTPYAVQDNWIKFSNTTSPATHTIPSLKQVLRFEQLEQKGMQPSIIDLFNAAGFKTFWLSNQTAPKTSHNILEAMTRRADSKIYINMSRQEGKSCTYDGELLPHLRNALKDPSPKKAIFLHFLGSHLTYAMRYPRKMKIFPTNSTEGMHVQDWYDSEAIKQVNDYDNSIAYTDFVLHNILKTMQNVTEPSFLLYFSDHGQDVYDSRYMRGCSEKRPTKNMVEIPMYLWVSPSFSNCYPAQVQFLRHAKKKAYSTKTLSTTIARLAHIKAEKLQGQHSLFSPQEDTNRKIYGHSYRKMER